MNRIEGVIRLHMKDRINWLIMPWLILLLSYVINLIIAGMINDTIYSGGLLSIFVYMFVIGIVGLAQTYPFAISFSVRRKDYFIGTLVVMTAVSLITTILLAVLARVENNLFVGWGLDLYFFNIKYLNEGNVWEQWWVQFSIMLHMFIAGLTISSIYRRFGRNVLIIFFIIIFGLLTIGVYGLVALDLWGDIVAWFIEISPSAALLSTWLVALTIIYAALSYVMLRKATV